MTPATLTHVFHNMGAEQLAAIKHINDIIQNAVLTHAETSRKAPDDHTTGVYTLFAAVRTENGVQPVKVKVKEYYLEGQEVPEPVKLYFAQYGEMNPYASAYDNRVLMLESMEKEEVSSSAASTATKDVTADNYPSTSSEISISELYELVNSEYAKDLPQKTADTGFLPNEYAAGISHAFTRRLDRLGKALGVSYVYDGSLGDGVNGMKQGNVIRLNPNASVNDGWIVGHETGHVMRTRATAEWGDLQAYLVQLDAKQTGRSQEERTVDIQKIYENHGQELTAEEAREEIACDMLGDILQDERLFDGFLRDVERGIVKPSVARKIIDALRDILDRIRHGSASLNAAEELGLTEQEIRKAMDKLSAVAKAAGENGDAAPEGGGMKYSLNENFGQQLDAWLTNRDVDGKLQTGGYFKIGATSKALQSIGVKDYSIYWSKTKIQEIMKKHPEMTPDVIKQVPNILEYPIIVMQSQTVANRIAIFGETMDDVGNPVLVAIELSPQNKRGNIQDFAVIVSAYGKNETQNLINNSDILYLDPDKKRTDTWLEALRLQLPAGLTKYGSIHNITIVDRDVNGNISFEDGDSKTAMQLAFEKARRESSDTKSSLDETREYKRELERMKRRVEHQAEAEKIKRESAQLVGSARAELRAAVGRDVESRLRASGAPDSMAEPLMRLLLEEQITDAQRALLNAEPAAQSILAQYAASEPEPVAHARAKLAAAEEAGVSRLLELAEAGRSGYNAITETDAKEGESNGREEQNDQRRAQQINEGNIWEYDIEGESGTGSRHQSDGGNRSISAVKRYGGLDPSFNVEPYAIWVQSNVIHAEKGTVSYAEQLVAIEYSVPSYVISNAEWDKNRGEKSAPAFSAQGQVYFRETLPEQYRGTFAPHELTHVMKQRGYEPYMDFLDRGPEMVNFYSQAAKTLLGGIARRRGIDLLNMTDAELITLYDEVNATVYGSIAVNDTASLNYVRDAFNDFNTYAAELSAIHEEFKRENKKRALNAAARQGRALQGVGNDATMGETRNSLKDLTKDETAALLSYKSSESYKLNAALRDGTLTAEQQRMVEALDSALEKLPRVEGTVYRTLSFVDVFDAQAEYDAFLVQHQEGCYLQCLYIRIYQGRRTPAGRRYQDGCYPGNRGQQRQEPGRLRQ